MFFKKFQTRLIVFFALLLTLLQLIIYVSVNDANIRNSKVVITESLEIGASVFNRLLDERTRNLFQHARLLSADYAFKPAFYSNDHGTILSAMENQLDRIEDADILMMVDLDSYIIADTRRPSVNKVPVDWPKLIEKAEQDDYAESTAVVLIEDLPFQIIVVPYLSPDIRAWILLGFAIDQRVADDLKQMVDSEISFFIQTNNKWQLTHTTLPDNLSGQLQKIQAAEISFNSGTTLVFNHEEYIALYTPLSKDNHVIGLLQRPLNEALMPYLRLNNTLQLLIIFGLFISFIGAIFIARKVTKPVKALMLGAKRIEQGEYQTQISTEQSDEIGQLANSFNQMAKGLEEKEKVRTLLGKVVSKEIAEELLSKDIELGGEEKTVTILFSDIRSFTQLCEGMLPKQVLEVLNVYLTQMSNVIEDNKGVIDKFIGDAIMAIFGVPITHGNDAHNAVSAALAMNDALNILNKSIVNQIHIGIGINTDKVVSGNMGSMNRLNYTVIGDGVNLASRLESLTKFYDIDLLVSESTKNAADLFSYQEIDKVRVKGKKNAVSIFKPIALTNQLNKNQIEKLSISSEMLNAYRLQKWNEAQEYLDKLAFFDDNIFCEIYRKRINTYRKSPPPSNWDHTFSFSHK